MCRKQHEGCAGKAGCSTEERLQSGDRSHLHNSHVPCHSYAKVDYNENGANKDNSKKTPIFCAGSSQTSLRRLQSTLCSLVKKRKPATLKFGNILF